MVTRFNGAKDNFATSMALSHLSSPHRCNRVFISWNKCSSLDVVIIQKGQSTRTPNLCFWMRFWSSKDSLQPIFWSAVCIQNQKLWSMKERGSKDGIRRAGVYARWIPIRHIYGVGDVPQRSLLVQSWPQRFWRGCLVSHTVRHTWNSRPFISHDPRGCLQTTTTDTGAKFPWSRIKSNNSNDF